MKKGQATIEYLTTYGWALMALVIVIGVIFASGILSPSYLVAEQCTFGSSFPCDLFIFNPTTTSASNITLRLHNGFPYTVNISQISLILQNGSTVPIGVGAEIESGDSMTVSTLINPPFQGGSVQQLGGVLTYQSCAEEINTTGCSQNSHNVTGTIVGTVNS